ncbi:MAG: hypothetical protein MHM6MM_005922 [Cercozoa sp. M6MM]
MCLRDYENIEHVSTGDLLRSEIAAKTALGKQIQKTVDEGLLVDDRSMVSLVKKHIFTRFSTKDKSVFLVDGFPRSRGNLQAWKEHVGNSIFVAAVLNYSCPLEELKNRIMGRALQAEQVRSDDNEETVSKRFDVFEKKTRVVLDYLEENSIYPVVNIDASKSPNAVYMETLRVVNSILSPEE